MNRRNLFIILLCIFSIHLRAQSNSSFITEVTGKGPAIIFIPGYSCSGEVWKETVEHLKNRYECHVLTIAGYAGVPAIDTPILQTVKNEIIAYVKRNKLHKPVVIGHSLGAFMSLWVSSEEPVLFGKTICVDGLPFLAAITKPDANAASMKKDPMFNPETVAKNFESLPDSGFIERTIQSMAWQVSDTARARQIAIWQYRSNRRALGLTLVEMSTTDLRHDIARIEEPVLVLGSIYFTKENSYKLIGEQFKNLVGTTIHVADSKHFIMYDQPQWMYKEIDEFLKK